MITVTSTIADNAIGQENAPQMNANSVSNLRSLSEIAIGDACIVSHIVAPAGMPEWATQLEDIGFIAGEPVQLMARGAFGGDPLVIRVGLSTFALRKAEAACVYISEINAINQAQPKEAA